MVPECGRSRHGGSSPDLQDKRHVIGTNQHHRIISEREDWPECATQSTASPCVQIRDPPGLTLPV